MKLLALAFVWSVIAASGAGARSAQVLYMLECQGCHLSDGRGVPDRVPALANHVARFLAVPGGREFLVRVPGAAQAPLDDAELARVLNWMLRTYGPRELADAHPPFSAAEVAEHRSRPLIDVEGTRAALLRRLGQ